MSLLEPPNTAVADSIIVNACADASFTGPPRNNLCPSPRAVRWLLQLYIYIAACSVLRWYVQYDASCMVPEYRKARSVCVTVQCASQRGADVHAYAGIMISMIHSCARDVVVVDPARAAAARRPGSTEREQNARARRPQLAPVSCV